ncbi:hypothetical protein [Pontivivens ytuae]|uniref:Uncharacterized protein n=1 Tax=Pontivivens ytuae TaxID=2789856 RepID=A0A7S9LQ83_9RHOB|nr:hypothetical protein [Pontivivens ytuae]QPH52725.1 hypothetical protein I0K15_12995 [Pontivivens ytuae]
MRRFIVAVFLATSPALPEAPYPIRADPPTEIPADHDPCWAWESETEFTRFFLEMDLEDRQVPFRVPTIYLEDAWDRVEGASHGAQLFSVGIAEFEPVSRPETGRRNRQGIWNWMTFTLSDLLPLDEIALLIAVSQDRNASTPEIEDPAFTIFSYEMQGGPHGLTEVNVPEPRRRRKTDIFLDLTTENEIVGIVECSALTTVPFPSCHHDFEVEGMTVSMSYRRTEFVNWRRHHQRVEQFLTCGRTASG